MQAMIKTKSFIQAFSINSGTPKGNGFPVVVRAPKTMKCFRATFVVNNYGNDATPTDLFISSEPTNQETQCLFLNGTYTISAGVTPMAPNIFVFDRRGVGYMEDEFYLYSNRCDVTIVWEGISEQ